MALKICSAFFQKCSHAFGKILALATFALQARLQRQLGGQVIGVACAQGMFQVGIGLRWASREVGRAGLPKCGEICVGDGLIKSCPTGLLGSH